MKETRLIMGMPITLETLDENPKLFELVFNYFTYVDEKFSTYKDTSEISKINRGEISKESWSKDMQEIFNLSEETKKVTDNFFDIKKPDGFYDPSGLVKGWAIWNASKILKENGCENFCLEAGGDVETSGVNSEGLPWQVGIRSPFEIQKIIKVLKLRNKAIATSGTYVRGQHIYNPKNPKEKLEEIASFTVVGPNIYEADRFATAAFAMGPQGIYFIENFPGLEGYMVNKDGIATMTSGFEEYLK